MKKLLNFSILSFFLLSMGVVYATHDHEDFHDHDQTDRDEYDLYERNRDDRDFNRFNYPSPTANNFYYTDEQAENPPLSR